MQQSAAESFAVLNQGKVTLAIALRDVEERSPLFAFVLVRVPRYGGYAGNEPSESLHS